jgi:hypothetical protein
MGEASRRRRGSGFFLKLLGFFDSHVAEFVRVEDFAAFLAFDVLDVLFARYNTHSGMFAGSIHEWFLAAVIWWYRQDCIRAVLPVNLILRIRRIVAP